MHKIVVATFAAFASLMALPVLAADYDCDNYDRDVYIYNASSSDITEVYSTNRDQSWDESYDHLNGTLSPGESVTLSVNDNTGYHVYDLMVYTEDGYVAYVQLNACQYDASWYINDEDLEEEGDY